MSLPRPLIERFLGHLAEVHAEVSRLEGQLGQAGPGQAGLGQVEAIEPLRVIAHKLAGTAEAYGFATVGRAARSLEEAIGAPQSGPSALAEPVRRLREALEDAIRDPPV